MKFSQRVLRDESPLEFAQRLGLIFADHRLLYRALTHRSYLNEHPEALEDNERLEFLGDAVLDFLVGAWLYNHYPEKSEGDLTRLRSALVRTEQLAEFAKQIDLGPVIRLGRGEAEAGGRLRLTLLCSTFEALIGALFIESGISGVCDFVEPMLSSAVQRIISARIEYDPKSRFQEWAQSQGYGAPVYRTITARGPDHAKTFDVVVLINDRVYGRGQGHSKQAAAKAAARVSLKSLGID